MEALCLCRFGDVQQHFLAVQFENLRCQEAALRVGLAAVEIDLYSHDRYSVSHDVTVLLANGSGTLLKKTGGMKMVMSLIITISPYIC
jgi:hypothetical protein